MQTRFLLPLLLASLISTAQKKEIFGSASFTIPASATGRAAGSNYLISSTTPAENYYSIEILSPAETQGSAGKDFQLQWSKLAEKFGLAQPPSKSRRPGQTGWNVQSGQAAFEANGQTTTLELVTYQGSGKSVNIIVLSNAGLPHPDVDFFFSGLTLKPLTPQGPLKPLTPQGPLPARPGIRTQ